MPNEDRNPQNASWLRLDSKLSPDFNEKLAQLASEVLGFHQIRNRIDARENTERTLSVLLASLLRSSQLPSNRYTIVSMNSKDYKRGPENPYGMSYPALQRIVEYLCGGAGPYCEIRKGGQFRDANGRVLGGHTTRLRANQSLIAVLRGPPDVDENNDPLDGFAIQFASQYERAPQPIIRLKDARGRLVEFEDTDEILGMRKRLNAFNVFIELQALDLLVPDKQIEDLLKVDNQRKSDAFGEVERRGALDLLFDRKLYRVFNNNSFDQGGRFYGGWWQHLPSALRQYITINWAPTVEYDFSNMQAAMLYALKNLSLPDDAYAIDGIAPEHRALIKRSFFKLINAEGHVRAPRKEELPAGWSWKELQEALKEKHKAIASYFYSGIGIKLQRTDSDIAECVMTKLMDQDVLALPVHDSFLVNIGSNTKLLLKEMQEAYSLKMGRPIGVEGQEIFVSRDDPQSMELVSEGIRDLEDVVNRLETDPAYAGYLQRKKSLLKTKDEAWRWRFYTG